MLRSGCGQFTVASRGQTLVPSIKGDHFVKAKSALEARLQEHASISALTSPVPSASSPSVAATLSKEIDTSNNSENRDWEIRELAYQLYQERGRAEGQALQDWLDAEAIIRQGGKVAA
jgi:hypothetical protein